MNGKKIILGIDISTTCTGVSIVEVTEDKPKILYIGHIKFKVPKNIKGTESLFLKSKQFKEFIAKYMTIGVTDIIIEEPLASSQNINTVNTLMKFNGMLSQSVYEATGIVPYYISSYDARKFAFPDLSAVRKFDKKGNAYPIAKIRKAIKNNELVPFGGYQWDCAKKLILWNKIQERYEGIEWSYNKKGDLKTENFDASDSLVCILGYINYIKYCDTEPNIIEYNEETVQTEDISYIKINYKTEFCGEENVKTIIFEKG